MSITDQFWQYAKEAVFSAATAKTDEDRQSLPAHARTWTQTALEEERQCTPSSVLSSPGAEVFSLKPSEPPPKLVVQTPGF
jgi:hypothetical protein